MLNRSEKLFDLIQMVTGAAVVVGLALFVMQLKQNEDLVRLQLVSSGWEQASQLVSIMMGGDFAETFKRIQNPESKLSVADLYRFDSYAISMLRLHRRNYQLAELGIFDTDFVVSNIDESSTC